jgi:trigger factor
VNTNISESSSTERVLAIEVERERMDRIFEEKVKKYSKEVRINGFRPGNVPKHIVAARFREPIANEALETLVDEALKEACKKHNIVPIAPGRVENLENQPGQPISFKVILEVDPPLEIKDYRMDIPMHPSEVGEGDIQGQLEALRKRKGEEAPVERAAQPGDLVVAEYQSIRIAGEEKPLPQNPEFRLELGASSVPELDQALLGCVAGEVRIAAFTFPSDYRQADLAGQRCEYRLRIVEIDEVKYPDLDDAFAKGFGFDSLEAFRARIREDLAGQALSRAKEGAYEEAIRRLLEANPFEVPKARVQNYVKYKLEEAGPHRHGEDCDHSDLEREAVFNIKRFRILDEIAKLEKIKPSPEEVDARIRDMAGQYRMEFEALKAALRKNSKINDIREELKSEKTLDFVIGLKPQS